MISLETLQAARILLVDDQDRNILLLERILRSNGYSALRSTTDSTQAVSLYREFRPDLVLLDLNMPGLDGFQVMEALRALPETQGDYLPILILTADFLQPTRLRALEAGAKDFLSKPFDLLEVLTRIRNMLHVRMLYNLLKETNRELADANRRLDLSYRESERLLLNVLPKPVADELKATGAYAPVRLEECSVLFTDFEGFTRIAGTLSPQDLVEELGMFFSAFDGIAEQHGLEKLKTIGDAYMAAGGLPAANRTHAVDCVLAALEIVALVEEGREAAERAGRMPWRIRVGVHTGPVMAGVIGTKKFAYDIWGDAVNLAARMQSAGEPGRVNVSAETHRRVEPFFLCEPRGKIEAKGKGAVDMFFLRGLRPEFAEDGAGLVPNARFRERYGQLGG